MAQITVHDDVQDPIEHDALSREHLRSAVPVLIAVALLFGVVMVCALALRDMVDFGVWFVSST